MLSHDMDQQLEVAKKLFAHTTKVIYVQSGGIPHIPDTGEIVLEPYKLKSCPDPDGLLKALAKKCSRIAVMRSQKYSAALCIALLASKGYCITSMELMNVPDTTIETCWESLKNIYVSIDEPLKSWLQSIIGSRDYVMYGLQFCQHRFLSSSLPTLGTKIVNKSAFKLIPREGTHIPDILWDRDDSVYSAISSHFRHEAREISDNT